MTHDPAIFCRPPEGTPPGTPCWLYYQWPDGKRDWCALPWMGDAMDGWSAPLPYGANRVARAGWRFHSIADVPE